MNKSGHLTLQLSHEYHDDNYHCKGFFSDCCKDYYCLYALKDLKLSDMFMSEAPSSSRPLQNGDACLSFPFLDGECSEPRGCSASCATFERFSCTLDWMSVQETDLRHMAASHGLNDLFAGRSGTGSCEYLLQVFQNRAKQLRVPLLWKRQEASPKV